MPGNIMVSPERSFSGAHLASDRILGMPEELRGTYIARLFVCLEACLVELGVTTDTHPDLMTSLESMACFIHESMSISSRNYHSVQHVFDVAENLDKEDAISVIASLFHDCVYYHVDGGLSELQHEKLSDVVVNTSDIAGPNVSVSLRPDSANASPVSFSRKHSSCCGDDEMLCMVEMIFGYTKGQQVNHQNGLNEFLSAVICVRELEPFLSLSVLAQIACCIEATIPFRSINMDTGKTCMQNLFDKLSRVNDFFGLDLSTNELVRSVQRAADVGNSDVANFRTSDVYWFLDNTWSLLPESNEGLRRQYLSTIREFQFAVFKMFGFFHFLNSEVVFPHFEDFPPPEQLNVRVAYARRNIELGRKYVGAKLLSLSVLAAISVLTGGDAPLSLFMGDLPSRQSNIIIPRGQAGRNCRVSNDVITARMLVESNPYPDDSVAPDIDKDVYEVLFKGRRSETTFDSKQSPMAAYLYAVLGDDELMKVLNEVAVYPMNEHTAKKLLRRLPRSAVQEVVNHVSKVAISRTVRILDLMKTL